MAIQNIRHDRVSALTGAPVPGKMEYVPVDGSYLLYLTDNTGTRRPPAVIAHVHGISDITGLQAALNDKASVAHAHAAATTSVAGFMSAADKVKLDASVAYVHPNSGVTAGTYRSVTVNAQGHVTGGSNPSTLSEYGISERYVALGADAGYILPTDGTVDLNSIAVTSEGYVTTGNNRPTGQAAAGYVSTKSTGGTSAFQTWFNPAAQDAFFFRRKNTSTTYDWLQVASREWVSAYVDTRWIANPATGTDLNTRAVNGGVDAYSGAANAPSGFGTILTFVGGSPTGNASNGSWTNQMLVTTGQDWHVRTGSMSGGAPTWNPTYQVWTSRQFTGTNVNNWNASYGWGNHASAGYLTSGTGISSSRAVNTGSGLLGGGNLTTDRTISVNFGASVGTVAQGNDQRILNGQISYERWAGGTGTGEDFNTRAGITGITGWAAGAPNRPANSFGTIFRFIAGTSTGEATNGSWANELMAGTGQDWFVRTGGGNGTGNGVNWNPTYQVWTSRQFTGANINQWNAATSNTGTVTQVGLVVPTGFSVLSSPVTSSGNLQFGFAGGYSLPTTAKQAEWDSISNRWVGISSGTDLNTRAVIGGVDAYGSAANAPSSFGTILRFIGGSSTGNATNGAWVNEIMATTGQDWFVRTGGGSGTNTANYNTTYQVWTSRQFTGANINQWNAATSNTGTVTQVGITVPTGFNVTSSPVTGSGNVSFEVNSGYFIPTNASKAGWDQSYNATITINGVTRVLRDSPSFSLSSGSGTVTQVGLIAPTGFDVLSAPVTGSGNLQFGFSGGYSLVSSSDRSFWNSKLGVSGSIQNGYVPVWANGITQSRIYDEGGSSTLQVYAPTRVSGSLRVTNTIYSERNVEIDGGLMLTPRLESQLGSMTGLAEGMLAYVKRDNGSGGVASGWGLWCYYGNYAGGGWKLIANRVWVGGGGAP